MQDLRAKFEQSLYAIDDRIESGEYKVLSLSQYLCKDDAEQELMGATIDRATGAIKIKRGALEIAKPKNSEELRSRLRLVAHTFILCQIRYPHQKVLQGATPVHFQRYADLLLGEHVYNLKAKDSEGVVVAQPTFRLLLSYEFNIRKEMVKKLNSGTPLVQALEAAMVDTAIKERYFLTPCAYEALHVLGHVKTRSRSRGREHPPRTWKESTPAKGGKNKSKGKSKRKRGLRDKTPGGREICFKWNNQGSRCRFDCGRVHACQICFGSHPAHACKKAKDTAGEGPAQDKSA